MIPVKKLYVPYVCSEVIIANIDDTDKYQQTTETNEANQDKMIRINW